MNVNKVIILKMILLLLFSMSFTATADQLSDELQWLAMYIACIGQYNAGQTNNYTQADPIDHYTPKHIREYLVERSGRSTVTNTFYGVCFDYALAAYNEILQNRTHYEELGMKRDAWYIAYKNSGDEIILFDPVLQGQHTILLNNVPVREHSRQNVQAHGGATNHAWLWVYGNDGTIYWIDPTWTDNTGYIWWGIVKDGEEIQGLPLETLNVVQINPNDPAFAFITLGDASRFIGDSTQAIEYYNMFLRIYPNHAIIYINRGDVYFNYGDYDSAIADYTEAIQLDYHNLAKVYFKRGMAYFCLATDRFTELNLINNSNRAEMYLYRDYFYISIDGYNKAIHDLEEAHILEPNNEDIIGILGATKYMLEATQIFYRLSYGNY